MDYIFQNPLTVLNCIICGVMFYHGVCMLNSRRWAWNSVYSWGYTFVTFGSLAAAFGTLDKAYTPHLVDVVNNFGFMLIMLAVIYRPKFRKPKVAKEIEHVRDDNR